MLTPTRILGIVALGLGLVLVAAAQPAPKPPRPAVAAILKLADDLEAKDVPLRARKIVEEHDSCSISQVFTLGQRGGAGVGSAVKAGHKNSLEDLVRNWSGNRPPTREELDTHQKDLLRAARVLQTMAELAPFRLPHIGIPVNEKRTEEWRKVSAEFKEVTRDLRDSIERTDPTEARKAAVRLQQTCNACHKVAGI
jgi:hypothetical protein